MTDAPEPQSLGADKRNVWMRGLIMVIFLVLFNVAQTLLVIVTIIQFFWMLFKNSPHQTLKNFGVSLGKWASQTANFQSGASEDKPFPWATWP